MSRWYLDTSAALKLLVEEAESAVLARTIDEEQPDLVACLRLETELRRACRRIPGLTQARGRSSCKASISSSSQPHCFRRLAWGWFRCRLPDVQSGSRLTAVLRPDLASACPGGTHSALHDRISWWASSALPARGSSRSGR